MNSKSILFFFLLLVGINLLHSQDKVNIVPIPVSLEIGEGQFELSGKSLLVSNSADAEHIGILDLFKEELNSITGFKPETVEKGKGKSDIIFSLDANLASTLGDEGYQIAVAAKAITITAANPIGWFYATRTLLQIGKSTSTKKETVWAIPCLKIEDYPRFEWRGLMLDVSRHFFSKEVIKSYIDQMAKYKLNTFHFHLTDNQGWRIEIKSLPELTNVGAWRVPRTGFWKGFKAPQPNEKATYGGFYSHEDIKELVAYAKMRNVTIVPEIDIPGHSLATIASYHNLSCTQTPQQVLAGDPWNASRTNVLCVANDSVYQMLDKVFSEIAELFPSKYIHIGGDEVTRDYWKKCPKCQKLLKDEGLAHEEDLQAHFIKKVIKIVESKGKKAMGWYENLAGGLVPNMDLMSWKDYKGGVKGSQEGHKVVMTPAFFTYLDFYQGDPAMENGPFTVCRLTDSYNFEPIQEGVVESNVLGGQGSLWTEQVPNERKLQYMTWPRAFALAEVLWSPKEKRDWKAFIPRMEAQFPLLTRDGVKYAEVFYEPIIKAVRDGETVRLQMSTEVDNLRVYYSFDDCSPDEFYPEYKDGELLIIPEGAHHIRAISYRDGKPLGRELNIAIEELIKRLPKQ